MLDLKSAELPDMGESEATLALCDYSRAPADVDLAWALWHSYADCMIAVIGRLISRALPPSRLLLIRWDASNLLNLP